jgi:hypothetical protein
VTSGTFGCHSSQRRRNASSAFSSSGSVKYTFTAVTSSPMDSAVEMPAAVSRDIDETGTTTSDFFLAGGLGILPSSSSAPIRS